MADTAIRPPCTATIHFADRHALGLVLVLAALVRLGHLLAQSRLPLFDALIIDSKLYDQWAQRIAAGDWMGGDGPFFMDPLYPYVLALLYRCFGHSLMLARLLQAALGVATCALVAGIGQRVGGRRTGIAAALLLALYQPLVFEGGEIEKTALGVFLLSASLLLAMKEAVASGFCAGACLALATLARGNLLLMVPLGALYFVCATPLDAAGASPVGRLARWRRRVLGRPGGIAAAFLAGFLLVLSPVLWRNHHVSGQWILTTSQAGANFYLGNNPANSTGAFSPLPFVRPSPTYEEGDFRTEAEAITGRHLTPNEASAFWFHQALDHIRQNPRFAALVCLRKATLFFSNLEVPDGWSMYFLRQYSPFLRVAVLTFGWLLPLALVGVAAFRGHRHVRLICGFVLAYGFSLVLFYVHSRYRVYVVPPVAVLAALGFGWLLARVRGGDKRRVLPATMVAGCACVFSFAGAPALLGIRAGDYVMNYQHLASLYEDRGDFPSAEKLLLEGNRRQPEAASILCGLASLYLRMDSPARALPYSEQCVRANEYFLDAWFVAGQANEAVGRIEEAKRCYRRQLEIVPGHQFAAICLQNLMTARRGPARALPAAPPSAPQDPHGP